MNKFFAFINSPGVFFIQTNSVCLDDVDAYAYAAEEVNVNPELLSKAVAAGLVGTVQDHDGFFELLCDKHLEWSEVCEQTLSHILECSVA